MSNENQTKFIALAKEFEALQELLTQKGEELETAMKELGIGPTLFQDPTSLAVYRIVKPKGTFTAYRDIGYQRTALEGETRGDVSKKDAEAAGFRLK